MGPCREGLILLSTRSTSVEEEEEEEGGGHAIKNKMTVQRDRSFKDSINGSRLGHRELRAETKTETETERKVASMEVCCMLQFIWKKY